VHPAFLHNNQNPVVPATAPLAAEDLEMAMAISASIHSALPERPPLLDAHPSSVASSSISWNNSVDTSSHGGLDVPIAPAPKITTSESAVHGTGPEGNSSQQTWNHNSVTATQTNHTPSLIPSAPPIGDEIIEDGVIHYPSIDSTPVDISSLTIKDIRTRAGERKENEGASSCVICLDAEVEGACIPCGHMAGCMSCLNEIKAKKWGCPVCRAKIDQVIKLFAV
jgi:hypothetical protein